MVKYMLTEKFLKKSTQYFRHMEAQQISLFLLFSLMIFSVIAKAPKAKAQEVDYVAAAISALQTSNVYVAPGIPEPITTQLTSYVYS
jgi:ABC-type microcin C transport system permease subunit YejE